MYVVKAPMRRFIIQNIKIPLRADTPDGYDEECILYAKKISSRSAFFRSCGNPAFEIYKKSVDARDKNKIILVYSVALSFPEESVANTLEAEKLLEICTKEKVTLSFCDNLKIPEFTGITRPVVCGFGPCGMFVSLVLARAGARPIVLERGESADDRVESVKRYWERGELSAESNVQFGEGGAGTFSDGKLFTRINDPLCSFVLETFAKHGASPEILISAKPHVGTDKLRNIVKSIRGEIISLGGEVRFNTKLTSLDFSEDRKSVKIGVNGDKASIITDALFLAIGHSARDTFGMLYDSGVVLQAKPFSVGVRIEHLQSEIDKSLYGDFAGHEALPKGEYALSHREGNRAVYTFCMCPGGTVVASASDKETIVTNGMSESKRDGVNANSAVAVSVSCDDFGNNPFSAIKFQEDIEKRAYKAAGGDGAAPVTTMEGFMEGRAAAPKMVLPTYTGSTQVCAIDGIFPSFVTDTLRAGFSDFDRKISGFADSSSVITAPETRTSSPVKLPRGDTRLAEGFFCLYTCGEGAGYAGGITSAAVDGIRTAIAYLAKG